MASFIVLFCALVAVVRAEWYQSPYPGSYPGSYPSTYGNSPYANNPYGSSPYPSSAYASSAYPGSAYASSAYASSAYPSSAYPASRYDADPYAAKSNALFTPPLAGNPSVRSYGYGFLGPQNRDNRGYLDVIGTRGTNGWGTYKPSYYDQTSRRVHPWNTQATGLLPWADSFHGNGLPTDHETARALSESMYGEDLTPYSMTEMYNNAQVNPLGSDPGMPGGENPLLAGANPHGFRGIGTLNVGSPVGLSYMGTGTGTGIGWYKELDGHPLPYVGYGPQGSAGMGSGTPLTEHPLFKTLPGIYHPPASNVFF